MTSDTVMQDKATLPKDITSYDLLKFVAVIIMIIDHAGFYFFPHDLWFRAVGRIGFPVWFFLVGYARGRDLPPRLWIGAIILTVVSAVVGMSILPLNTLVTIIVIRLTIGALGYAATRSRESFIGIMAIMLLMIIPTSMLVEYGTLALICALFGYFARNRPTVPGMGDAMNALTIAMTCMAVSFLGMQIWSFGFAGLQAGFVIGGTFVTTFVLLLFRPMTFPRLTHMVTPVGQWLIQLGGRRTLEIYILHLVAFKIAMLWYRPDDAALFDWVLFSSYGF